jgi:hypothetical protein
MLMSVPISASTPATVVALMPGISVTSA